MERGRPKKAEITLSQQEHAELQVLARSRSLPHSVVRRAQMILMSAEGYSNSTIAEHFGLTLPNVGHRSTRLASQETGISKSTGQRYLHLFDVPPHRSKPFKLFD